MENNDFNCTVSANIGAEEAIRKICRVPEWWGVTFTGNAAQPQDVFVINMGPEAFFHVTVTELLPGKRMVWQVMDCHMPWYSDKKEWAGTRLVFDLCEHDGGTELTFTHEGLTPGAECYQDCVQGWTHWIKTSLGSYLATGKGVFRAPTK